MSSRVEPTWSRTIGGLITLLLTASVFVLALLPAAWILAELWARIIRRPAHGFRLTDEEYAEADEALRALSEANDEIEETQNAAESEGLRVRQDGQWDERSRGARQLNKALASAVDDAVSAKFRAEYAAAGPRHRFTIWAKPQRAAWALRAIMVVASVGWFAGVASPITVMTELVNRATLQKLAEAWLASGSLLIITVMAGSAGYGIGVLVTRRHAPPNGWTLLSDAKARECASEGSAS